MQFLGIGSLEFLLIVVVAVLVLGPRGMVQAAREAGKLIRKVVRSPLWRDVVETSREIREFPRKIVREAGIEEEIDELRRSTQGTLDEIDRFHHPVIKPQAPELPQKLDHDKKKEQNASAEGNG